MQTHFVKITIVVIDNQLHTSFYIELTINSILDLCLNLYREVIMKK